MDQKNERFKRYFQFCLKLLDPAYFLTLLVPWLIFWQFRVALPHCYLHQYLKYDLTCHYVQDFLASSMPKQVYAFAMKHQRLAPLLASQLVSPSVSKQKEKGSYFGQNTIYFLATSVLVNSRKVWPLTKKITKSTFCVTKWLYLGSEAENQKNRRHFLYTNFWF